MEPITAQCARDLLAALKQIDISVPLRSEGRTSEQCERWSMCRMLATFADADLFTYPLNVVHRDRPDFLIQFASGECGVEITEVVPENAAAIDAYRENHDIEGTFFLQRFRPGDARLRGKELRDRANSVEPSDGWAGNSVELEWVDAAQAFIGEKIRKSRSPGFDLFGENWLLMYFNWSLPAVDQKTAAEMLFNSLGPDAFDPFERVFVEHGDQIWIFTGKECSSRPVNDLWART